MKDNIIEQVVDVFCETVSLKLKQFRKLVPKNTNAALTGQYVESVVKTFVTDWIRPFTYHSGTLYPHESCPKEKVEHLPFKDTIHNPKQIDGIIYDPSLGPSILKEDGFIIAHPAFCRGIIEIKTSEKNIEAFYYRLQELFAQYFFAYDAQHSQVCGIVIHSENPILSSRLTGLGVPIYNFSQMNHTPVFILFNNDYEPHLPAIESMIMSFFRGMMRRSLPACVLGSWTPTANDSETKV